MRRFQAWGSTLVLCAASLVMACGDTNAKSGPAGVDVTTNNADNSATNSGTSGGGTNNGTNNGGTGGGGGGGNGGNANPTFVLDLRVDTNRDGTIDVEGDTDELAEDVWNGDGGAIMLANIDDDDESCPTRGSDAELAACNDASEPGLDGDDDLLDMATVEVLPAREVPDDVSVRVEIESPGKDRSRLFFERDGWVEWDAESDTLTATELRAGATFKVEGTDIPRDDRWNGDVRITATASGSFGEDAVTTDTVALRIAPLILRHHLDPAVSVYSSELGIGGDGAFTDDLVRHIDDAATENGHFELPVEDQWTQDYFETAYMAMPTESGLHVIDVYIRSANVEQDYFTGDTQLRPAGRVVFTAFRGPDRAGFSAVDYGHNSRWDTLNSFGNTETIPPHDGYPMGRIIRGTGNGYAGDADMIAVFEQGVQDPLYVDTGWLMVSHIDETISFVKNEASPLGWSMLVNDAAWARQMLVDLDETGQSDTTMFGGKYWYDFNSNRQYSALASVDDVLNDPVVMASSAEAVIEIDEQVRIIQDATGLPDDQLIPIPFLHMDVDGASIAYQPGIVNGLYVDATTFIAPEPHGPIVDGKDILKDATEQELGAIGIDVKWNEDWDMYHRLSGEVHCGTNVRRAVPQDARWWEAAQ